MTKPVRIIEKTPLGYIIEIVHSGERLMIPKKILRQKFKVGIYHVQIDPKIKGERA